MSVYAISDLHGNLNIFNQIKQYIEKNDIVYVLGDCGDRGPEPWKTITEVAKDGRFIYLKGNHEDMLIKAYKEYKETESIYGQNCSLLIQNGGFETLMQMSENNYPMAWCSFLNSRPFFEVYNNKNHYPIYLSHAGFTPYTNFQVKQNNLIWDRFHFYDNQLKKEWKPGIVVHGHTPIQIMCDELGIEMPKGALWYSNNKKVCIDRATYHSKELVMLNLDTFEEIMFYDK